MHRHPGVTPTGLSRRATLGRVAAVGAALGLGSRLGRAAAQDAATEMATHPIVGCWQNWVPKDPGITWSSASSTPTAPSTTGTRAR